MRPGKTLTGREASIFAAVTDCLLDPEPELPPVRETDTVASLDRWLARVPALNRVGIRIGLYLVEIAPVFRYGRRFRRLDRARRTSFLAPERARRPALIVAATDTLRMLAAATYYADDRVARQLGYDADARVERGRQLRASEGRP